MKRAFRTIWKGIESIVSAHSSSKARYITYLSARETFRNVNIVDIRVIREPKYDEWALVDESKVCWGEPYLQGMEATK